MQPESDGRERTKRYSTALDEASAAETPLGQWAKRGTNLHGGDSGFMLLSGGVEAFALRADLAQRTAHTLDVQTYILENGLTTRLLFRQMLAVAERGVRVRFLLDDLTVGNQQGMLAVLDSHPHIEVRLFNPIPYGRGHAFTRMLVLALGAGRLHRRMHNKLWLTDNAIGITGGRNMADDYFNADFDHEFSDLDILAAGGSAVPALSQSFDAYWNHALAKPLAWFEQAKQDSWRLLWTTLEHQTETELTQRSQYYKLLKAFYHSTLDELLKRLCYAKGNVIWDDPDKLAARGSPESGSLMSRDIGVELSRIKTRIMAVSGYFIPDRLDTIDIFALAERGVDVTVVTNTLEATDVALVHGGYAPSRVPLLRAGVRLHEYRCQQRNVRDRLPQARSASLHAKAMALDDDRIIIGSFNLDPRSVWWNSEIALIVEGAELNQRLCELGAALLSPERSYEVTLNEHDALSWCEKNDEQEEYALTTEPGSRWRRLQASLSAKLRLARYL